MTSWYNDMSIAPQADGIDIVDKWGTRYVRCRYVESWDRWEGLDLDDYEPISNTIYEPVYWMKVEMPND